MRRYLSIDCNDRHNRGNRYAFLGLQLNEYPVMVSSHFYCLLDSVVLVGLTEEPEAFPRQRG